MSQLCTQRRCAGSFGLNVHPSPAVPVVVVARLFEATLIAAVGSASANSGIWLLGNFVGRMTIGVGEVAVGSLIGVVGAALVLVILSRFVRHPKTVFIRVAIAVLVLYALGPISAALAPYREGAEKFNLTTVLATEVMHLVCGLWVIAAFTSPRVIASKVSQS